MEKLTVAKLMDAKRRLAEAEKKRPKHFINGEEYILIPELDKEKQNDRKRDN